MKAKKWTEKKQHSRKFIFTRSSVLKREKNVVNRNPREYVVPMKRIIITACWHKNPFLHTYSCLLGWDGKKWMENFVEKSREKENNFWLKLFAIGITILWWEIITFLWTCSMLIDSRTTMTEVTVLEKFAKILFWISEFCLVYFVMSRSCQESLKWIQNDNLDFFQHNKSRLFLKTSWNIHQNNLKWKILWNFYWETWRLKFVAVILTTSTPFQPQSIFHAEKFLLKHSKIMQIPIQQDKLN